MNKYEQVGAQELLSMLNDGELMSVKDTVTKSVIPTNSVRQKKSFNYSSIFSFKFSVQKLLMLALNVHNQQCNY
jgi:hypothetical protein